MVRLKSCIRAAEYDLYIRFSECSRASVLDAASRPYDPTYARMCTHAPNANYQGYLCLSYRGNADGRFPRLPISPMLPRLPMLPGAKSCPDGAVGSLRRGSFSIWNGWSANYDRPSVACAIGRVLWPWLQVRR